MSKSLKRVRAALDAAGANAEVRETPLARTAADAAKALGCEINQIAKSIVFHGTKTDEVLLFLTAGGNRVDDARAATVAGTSLGKADADLIRSRTGFAIGGVAPVGHLSPMRAFFDPRLLDFPLVWAAAGTPHHVFSMIPQEMAQICNAQIVDFIMRSQEM